jgi:hypothetical protein
LTILGAAMTRFGSPFGRSWLFMALLGSGACHARSEQVEPESSASSVSAEAARPPVKRFGAPITAAPELVLADVLRAPERYENQAITVEGHVRSACTRRGCWMEVATSGDPALPGCRVTFKDYGFFVPTDSAGASAKVQGTLDVNTLPPERVAHLESEGGHFPQKNPDGSVNELRLVATGVELWR